MKESEIRLRDRFDRYLELAARDAEMLIDRTRCEDVPCPVCGSWDGTPEFEKSGFVYRLCGACDTLFLSPRPSAGDLARLYKDSESTRYWINEFFAPVAEARRVRIFRPRAEFITERFSELSEGRVADIGAGFGLFLKELRGLWPRAELVGIEPSADMANRMRADGFQVIEAMFEDVGGDVPGFDLLTAFEFFEPIRDPEQFLAAARRVMKPGGYLMFTTLSGLGLDIQLFWERSKALSPPHHLNFANPFTIGRLLDRVGFRLVEAASPGVLDWDIVESGWLQEGKDPGRFFRAVAKYGTSSDKQRLQEWVTHSGFSSHMRVIAQVDG